MAKKIKVTAEVFNAALQLGHFRGGKSLEGARLMLVDGLTAADAGKQLGVSLQTVARCARDVRKILLGQGMCPMCGNQIP